MEERDHRARRISMPVTEVFAAITVRDRDAAIEFYERLLGAPQRRRHYPLSQLARGPR
jgi:predicted enzyme related to lactoylglutathione lyase